jgi:hypothetical protein
MTAAMEIALEVGVQPACAIFGVPRATVYRRRRPRVSQARPRPARALSEAERAVVLGVLCSERFVDASPAEWTRCPGCVKRPSMPRTLPTRSGSCTARRGRSDRRPRSGSTVPQRRS